MPRCALLSKETYFVNDTYHRKKTSILPLAPVSCHLSVEGDSRSFQPNPPQAQGRQVSCTDQEPVSPGALVPHGVGHTASPATFPPEFNRFPPNPAYLGSALRVLKHSEPGSRSTQRLGRAGVKCTPTDKQTTRPVGTRPCVQPSGPA